MKRRKQYDEGNKIGTIKQRAIKKKEESLHHKHKNVGLEGERQSILAAHPVDCFPHGHKTHTATKHITLNKKYTGILLFFVYLYILLCYFFEDAQCKYSV